MHAYLLPFFVDNGLNLLGDNTDMTHEGAGHNEGDALLLY